jgi:hypothetical protein
MELPVASRPIGGHLGIKKPPIWVVTLIRLTTNYRYFADPIAAPGYSPSLASLPARG